jgi:hypothetical protein
MYEIECGPELKIYFYEKSVTVKRKLYIDTIGECNV